MTPVGISVDELEGAKTTLQTYEVPFPLWSDPDLKAHEAFKVVLEVPPAGVEKLQGYGISLERWSKRKHHKIAIPSIFILDRQRKVLWAHADQNHRRRPKLEQLLAVIDGLGLPGKP